MVSIGCSVPNVMSPSAFSLRAGLLLGLTGFLLASRVSALSCPSDAELVVRNVPQGKEERCVLKGNGKRHGPFQTWYSGGNLKAEGTYRYGQAQGNWTYYYPSGEKRMEGTWRSGKAQGSWTFWYENGMRESTGRFRGGKREGGWTYWDTAGNVRFEGEWADDKLHLGEAQASAQKRQLR
jgi:hypothetical protein